MSTLQRTPSSSFQIPDLLAVIAPLELRTNDHCRWATDASEKWVREADILTASEVATLRSSKMGLLAALCFPTCDAPQLRMLTNIATLLQYSALRLASSRTAAGPVCRTGNGGFDALPLLKDGVDPQFDRVIRNATIDWRVRFSKDVEDTFYAQQKCRQWPTTPYVPTLYEYQSTRPELFGAKLIIDLAEVMEVFTFPDNASYEIQQQLLKLKEHTITVIAWATDIAAYQFCSSLSNTHNLVYLLMSHNHISLQGAMNLAGTMLRTAFNSFVACERELINLLHPESNPQNVGIGSFFITRVWKSLTGALPVSASSSLNAEGLLDVSSAPNTPSTSSFSSASSNVSGDATVRDAERYILALKDCMVGTIHWLYETELFFGSKGNDVRMFGWVFANEATPEQASTTQDQD